MCQLYPDNVATVKVTYGLYSEYEKGRPHYVYYLCEKAHEELWNGRKPTGDRVNLKVLVNLGLAHYVAEKINGND